MDGLRRLPPRTPGRPDRCRHLLDGARRGAVHEEAPQPRREDDPQPLRRPTRSAQPVAQVPPQPPSRPAAPRRAAVGGGRLWAFPTGKGIFSTPVIDGDGTVYVGSADRTFYALAPDGTVRWQLLTGEIIDSAALLDDRGRVYVGSGDGKLYALDAATGDPVWTFTADPPAVNDAFINWFEGNVAMGVDGTLYVPNDNFFTYAHRSRHGGGALDVHDARPDLVARRRSTPRRAGSSSATTTCSAPRDNTFALDAATGRTGLEARHATAPSPRARCSQRRHAWSSAASTASCAATIGRPAVLVLDVRRARPHLREPRARCPTARSCSRRPTAPCTGSIRRPARCAGSSTPATPSARRPRSTATATSTSARATAGCSCSNPDGTLRWSMQLIDAPARRPERVARARPRRHRDRRRERRGLQHPVRLVPAPRGRRRCALPTSARRGPAGRRRGPLLDDAVRPAADRAARGDRANQPLTFSLFVRAGRRHRASRSSIPPASHVTVDPPAPIRTEVSGDRKFITIIPHGAVRRTQRAVRSRSTIAGDYLVNPTRDGPPLHRRHGRRLVRARPSTFTVRPAADGGALPLPVPAAPGDPAGIWELSRLAAPLPTILPSYNQIGFDSLHYLIGLVEGDATGRAIAWVVGGKPRRGREPHGRRPGARACSSRSR